MYIPDYIFMVHLREKFNFSRDLVHYLAVGFCLDPLEGIDTSVKNVPDLKKKTFNSIKSVKGKVVHRGTKERRVEGVYSQLNCV